MQLQAYNAPLDEIVAIGTRSTFLGRSPQKSTSGEGFDLSSLELPGRQLDLLKAIKATGKPIVIVFISGKPLAMPWVKENADAVLLQWYAGEMQGISAANLLTGKVNPSGRLNVSFPRSTGNTPCYYNHYVTDRNEPFDQPGSPEDPKGHYIFDAPNPLWAFGSGKSYSDFKYLSCTLNDSSFTETGTIKATVEIENTSSQDGKEVVQLYIRDQVSSVATPIQQLKAFQKVFIPAGKKVKVQLEVPIVELGLYDDAMKYVIEPGLFDIQIGKASDNIIFHKVINVKTNSPKQKTKKI